MSNRVLQKKAIHPCRQTHKREQTTDTVTDQCPNPLCKWCSFQSNCTLLIHLSKDKIYVNVLTGPVYTSGPLCPESDISSHDDDFDEDWDCLVLQDTSENDPRDSMEENNDEDIADDVNE
jgi:hypothetical protein